MSSFDVHYDDVAPKIEELEKVQNAKNGHNSSPLNLLFFVPHHHNVTKKQSFYTELIFRSQKYT